MEIKNFWGEEMKPLSQEKLSLREWIIAYCEESNSRRIPKEVVLQILDNKLAWAKSWREMDNGFVCDDCKTQGKTVYGGQYRKINAVIFHGLLCKDCLLSRAFGEVTKR